MKFLQSDQKYNDQFQTGFQILTSESLLIGKHPLRRIRKELVQVHYQVLFFVYLVIDEIKVTPRKPATIAPIITTKELLKPPKIKPTTIPGRTACESVSLNKDNLLVTTSPPINPQPIPIKITPSTTT